MTSRRSRLTATLAVVTACALSSCGLLGQDKKADPTPTAETSVSQISAGPESSSAPSASSTGKVTSKPPVDTSKYPFAGFNLAKHQVSTKYTSPDRMTDVTSDAKPEGFANPPKGQGIQRYANQKIQWRACGNNQCGTVLVPLDWDDPDGQAITLKMLKKEGTGTHKGTLFVNPGGPGGSGQDMASSFDAKAFPGFDVIGWDPRGSGDSTLVKCASDAEMDKFNAVDLSPSDEGEWNAMINSAKAFAKSCRENSGPLLDHISTIDNVRDLDYLRHLVGDEKLTYLGISYGTFVGSVYAELYPQRVGRLVLDSAVNITENESVIQAMGFDLAFKNFATWCAEQKCQLGGTAEQVQQKVVSYLDGLDKKPIEVKGRPVDDSVGALGIAAFLYAGAQGYPNLYNSLMWAITQNDPQYLQLGADFLAGRDSKGHYGSLAFAFPAIACADSADGGLADARKAWPEDEKKAPIFGKYMGPGMQCTYWTAKPMPQLKITAKGAAPILVLGATGDPATPFQQAVWMADQLDSGVLITWKGAGHSAYELGNECVKQIVHNYVNQGKVPKPTTC